MFTISCCWARGWTRHITYTRYRVFNINTMAGDISSKKDSGAGSNSIRSPVEMSIDVPWGQICGKAWGSSSGKPVLALHGWLDNAGSFDKLIPLLSRDLYIVAIDWPGHGLSSPRPAGAYYHLINMVADLKYVVDGLGWKRFTFLSHSMGAAAATQFAASLPEYVEKLVSIEGLVPLPVDNNNIPEAMGKSLKSLPKLQDKAEKVYPTKEACVARLMEATTYGKLTEEAAKTLCVRGIAPADNGYMFTRDPKLKLAPMPHASIEVTKAFLKALQCPVFVVKQGW
ncbi:serine hydrolase-like protein isoform X2 [Dysidea avara]|uniref:serine hydrolase-like protein isoform X2 n=1 Tax=Dysidea avara TaxID=196820 RepID=UPI0033321B42